MIERGFARCSASAAAARAARAQERSVSISVRTARGAAADAIATEAPARRREAASSSSALRSPVVEPSETISTSRAPAGAGGLISGHGPVDAFHAAGFEAGGPQQRDRLKGRCAAHVESGPVALLDRRHRAVLAP